MKELGLNNSRLERRVWEESCYSNLQTKCLLLRPTKYHKMVPVFEFSRPLYWDGGDVKKKKKNGVKKRN